MILMKPPHQPGALGRPRASGDDPLLEDVDPLAVP